MIDSGTDSAWKHRTARHPFSHAQQAGIDLFDDEDPGQFSIYVRHNNGERFPARTVTLSDSEHAKRVLDAWALRGTVNDYRQNRSIAP